MLPRNIIEQIKFFCDSNGYGFSQCGSFHDQDMTVLVIGKSELGINTANVMAAHAILTAVVSGLASVSNETKEQDESSKPRIIS